MINVNSNSHDDNCKSNQYKFCTAILVENDAIVPTPNPSFSKFKTCQFGEEYRLTYNSRFYDNKSVLNSMGTCFAISDELIVTAKHVILNGLINTMSLTLDELFTKIKFVFGFNSLLDNHNIRNENIFEIESVHNDTYSKTTNPYDFIILKVKDKKIPPENIGKLTYNKNHGQWRISMIGHPYGMPLVKSNIAKIKDIHEKGYYITTLSAFNGNSGSPVFNQHKEIIGIMHGGGSDFEKNEDQKTFRKLKYSTYNSQKKNGILVLPIHLLQKHYKI
ncbi:MAG: serine protease [Chitinophagales bacterium]